MAVPYHTHSFEIPSATKSEVEAGVRTDVAATPASLGSAASKDISYFATSEQGEAATTAVQSVNEKTGKTITLAKADIGLGNVENTSDADKPISSATQSALILKANTSDLGTAASRNVEDFATAAQGELASTSAQQTVTLTAGAGLTGGGTLAENRIFALSSTSLASLVLADTAVQPFRRIIAGIGLTGGGDLSGDRSIALSADSLASLSRADSAVQPFDLGALALKDSITTTDISAAGSADPDAVLTRGGLWIKPTGIGDMLQAVYDPDGTGKVLIAKEAEKVALGSVTGLQEVLDEKANTSDLNAFDTKEKVDNKIETALIEKAVRVDVVQNHTEAEQGQARANIGAGVLSGFRNKIINGDIGISQRGTSFTVAPGEAKYTADRWAVYNTTDQICTVYIWPSSATSWPEIGHPPYMEFRFNVAPTTGNVAVSQPIEHVRTLAGKSSTLTFYSGASSTEGDVSAILEQSFGGAGSSPTVTVAGDVRRTVLTAGNTARWDYLFDIPSIEGKSITGLNNTLRAIILLTPRSLDYFYLTKISLVEGDATAEADPFSPRHIQQELALCQRYFEAGNIAGFAFSQNLSPDTVCTKVKIEFRVDKRITPSAVISYVYQGNGSWVRGDALEDVGIKGAHAALMTGSAGFCDINFNWASDAEF